MSSKYCIYSRFYLLNFKIYTQVTFTKGCRGLGNLNNLLKVTGSKWQSQDLPDASVYDLSSTGQSSNKSIPVELPKSEKG